MNTTLLKSLIGLAAASLLLAGSLVAFKRARTLGSLLQVIGAGGLLMVGLAHISEALHLFPWMHWGLEQSAGHYLDLCGAVLGLALFPVGYLLHALTYPQT